MKEEPGEDDSKAKRRGAFARTNALIDNGWLPMLSEIQNKTWQAINRSADNEGVAFPGLAAIAKRTYGGEQQSRSRLNHVRAARADLHKKGLLRFVDNGNPDHVQLLIPRKLAEVDIPAIAPESGAKCTEIRCNALHPNRVHKNRNRVQLDSESGAKCTEIRCVYKDEGTNEGNIEGSNEQQQQNNKAAEDEIEKKKKRRAELSAAGISGKNLTQLSEIEDLYPVDVLAAVLAAKKKSDLRNPIGWIVNELREIPSRSGRLIDLQAALTMVNSGAVESVVGNKITARVGHNSSGLILTTLDGKRITIEPRYLAPELFELKPIGDRVPLPPTQSPGSSAHPMPAAAVNGSNGSHTNRPTWTDQ